MALSGGFVSSLYCQNVDSLIPQFLCSSDCLDSTLLRIYPDAVCDISLEKFFGALVLCSFQKHFEAHRNGEYTQNDH